MRIASFNIETLAPHLIGERAALVEIAERLGEPDVLCLQEIRLRPADRGLIEAMGSALPGYDCGYALADDSRNASFRGGRTYGVATFTKRALRSKHERVDWDREGRILFSRVPGLVIGNVYAVNGTDKPYFDHTLGRCDGDRHGFKRRFMDQIIEHCAEVPEPLVLIGDWNVSRSKIDIHPRLRTAEPHVLARAKLNDELLPRLRLVDAFRELHPETRKYTWFNKRARWLDAARVDYALVSTSVMDRVREADIDESKNARFGSDHAPLWVDLV